MEWMMDLQKSTSTMSASGVISHSTLKAKCGHWTMTTTTTAHVGKTTSGPHMHEMQGRRLVSFTGTSPVDEGMGSIRV
jgi:hypothetical protein